MKHVKNQTGTGNAILKLNWPHYPKAILRGCAYRFKGRNASPIPADCVSAMPTWKPTETAATVQRTRLQYGH